MKHNKSTWLPNDDLVTYEIILYACQDLKDAT